tara:strand:- start:33 stop:188 length:156 start_codon:yes stop_codon:yes gene_type:complete
MTIFGLKMSLIWQMSSCFRKMRKKATNQVSLVSRFDSVTLEPLIASLDALP